MAKIFGFVFLFLSSIAFGFFEKAVSVGLPCSLRVLHAGADATAHIALMEKHGVLPGVESILVAGGSVRLGPLFRASNDGRIVSLAIVQARGSKFLRLFAKIPNHSTWQVLPANFVGLNSGSLDYLWESAYHLPAQVEIALTKAEANPGARSIVDGEAFRQLVSGAMSPFGSIKYQTARSFGVAPFDPITAKIVRSSADQHQMVKVDPRKLIFGDSENGPDYSQLVDSYEYTSPYVGRVKGYVYASKDRKWDFNLRQQLSSGRIWPAAITSRAPINRFGVPKISIYVDAFTMPIYRSSSRLAPEFRGQASALHQSVVDTWPFLKQVPWIQEFYKSQGLPIPN